jgi:hypothetical protein
MQPSAYGGSGVLDRWGGLAQHLHRQGPERGIGIVVDEGRDAVRVPASD